MSDLLAASRSVGSWKCEPMTVDQIDAHPERDRIWATIESVRAAREIEIEGLTEAWEEEAENAADQARVDEGARCRDELADAIENMIENEEISDTLAAKIRKLKDAI